MTSITFVVPGVPVAQPRQRHAVIAGHLRNYTPSRHPVNTFKAACQLSARQAYSGPPLTGPLVCELVFVLPRPRSAPKRTGGRLAHCKRPDAENLAKSVLDALTGLLYDDDRQIWRLVVTKWVAAVDEQPQVEIHVREVEE